MPELRDSGHVSEYLNSGKYKINGFRDRGVPELRDSGHVSEYLNSCTSSSLKSMILLVSFDKIYS